MKNDFYLLLITMKERFSRFFSQWLGSFSQYYLSYLSSFLIGAIIIIQQHIDYNHDYYNIFWSICAGAWFVFVLALCLPLYKKFKNTSLPSRAELSLQGIVTLIGVGMGIFFYTIITSTYQIQSQIILFFLIALWTIATVPLLIAIVKRTNHNIQFNWSSLFSLVILACLSALILWGGISACLGSIEYLFGIFIKFDRYADLGALSFFVIGSSIFLTQLHHKSDQESTNKREMFFGLYIFLPLALLYAIILASYAFKILTIGVWPQWLVSYMVIGYTIWWFIAYFLTIPFIKEKSWITIFHHSYFISIICFSVLLFWAIGIRIEQYGLTEMRYLVVLIGIWIVGTGVMGLIRPHRSLFSSIILLCAFLLISIYSPLSATRLSRQAQFARLETQLEALGRYTDGVLNTDDKDIDSIVASPTQKEQFKAMIATSEYIIKYHGGETLKKLQPQLWDEPINTLHSFSHHVLGITGDINLYDYLYDYPYATIEGGKEYFSVYRIDNKDFTYPLDISKYNNFYIITSDLSNTDSITINDDKKTITLFNNITIDLNEQLAPKLYDLSKAQNEGTQQQGDFILYHDQYTIIILDWAGEKDESGYELSHYSFLLFLK